MEEYEKVLVKLFQKDTPFALATCKENCPTVRMVDFYYKDGAFYGVSYGTSRKMKDIEHNAKVALCKDMYRFEGEAYNIGHPLLATNKVIREELIKAFEKWYFLHNNEQDKHMCYMKIELNNGFFYADGIGYQVDFKSNSVKNIPFTYDLLVE